MMGSTSDLQTSALAVLISRLSAEDGVVLPGGPGQPALLHLSPRAGVTGFDVLEEPDPGAVSAALAGLGRRLESVQLLLDGVGDIRVRGFLVCSELTRGALGDGLKTRSMIASDELRGPAWLARIRRLPTSLPDEAFARLRAALSPQSLFVPSRSTADAHRADRDAARLQLDLEQERLAMRPYPGILLITGGAGTGKTLVAAARARRLAADHPEWRVALVCFNRTLATQLAHLVADMPSIEVTTFHSWSAAFGLTVDIRSDDRSERRVDEATARGVGRDSHDAVICDEGQDFAPAWFRFAWQTVRPGRGGLTILADPAQALYGEAELDGWTHETIAKHQLYRAYRSTRPILQAAVVSTGVGELPGEMMEGRPVQLVWAPRWDDQAAFVGWEIQSLVASGDYRLRDIGLLYTQRAGSVNRLRAMLDAGAVPHYWVNEDPSSKRTMPDTDTMRLLTVHAAKGLEFPVVFLFGLEALRVDSEDSDAALRFARVGYVGMTRGGLGRHQRLQHLDSQRRDVQDAARKRTRAARARAALPGRSGPRHPPGAGRGPRRARRPAA